MKTTATPDQLLIKGLQFEVMSLKQMLMAAHTENNELKKALDIAKNHMSISGVDTRLADAKELIKCIDLSRKFISKVVNDSTGVNFTFARMPLNENSTRD